MADLVLSEKDNGALVQAARGSKITIELEENPTTGFQWFVNGIDEVFLAPEGDAFLVGVRWGWARAVFADFSFAPKVPAPLR